MEGLHFSARATEFSGPALYILVEACVGVSWNPHGLSSNYHEGISTLRCVPCAPVFCSLFVAASLFLFLHQMATFDWWRFQVGGGRDISVLLVYGCACPQSELIRLVGFMGQQKNRPSSLVIFISVLVIDFVLCKRIGQNKREPCNF
jgi:hypothetical protein